MLYDIFRLFIERDMMLEATILAEKELADANLEEEAKNDIPPINESNEDTEVIDRMVEDEMFYLKEILIFLKSAAFSIKTVKTSSERKCYAMLWFDIYRGHFIQELVKS